MSDFRKGYILGVKDFQKVMLDFDVGFEHNELKTKKEMVERFPELAQEALSKCKEILLKNVRKDETSMGYKRGVETCCKMMQTFKIDVESDIYSFSYEYKGRICKMNFSAKGILNKYFMKYLEYNFLKVINVCFEVALKEVDYE